MNLVDISEKSFANQWVQPITQQKNAYLLAICWSQEWQFFVWTLFSFAVWHVWNAVVMFALEKTWVAQFFDWNGRRLECRFRGCLVDVVATWLLPSNSSSKLNWAAPQEIISTNNQLPQPGFMPLAAHQVFFLRGPMLPDVCLKAAACHLIWPIWHRDKMRPWYLKNLTLPSSPMISCWYPLVAQRKIVFSQPPRCQGKWGTDI